MTVSFPALKQYNGVPLDGRPMRIEIAGSERELTASAAPLRRVAPSGRVGGGAGGRMDSNRRSPGPRPRSNSRGAGAGAGGRGGRGGGARKERDPPKSKEDLDAEMDAYMSTKETA